MSLPTALTEMFGIDHPIVLAPMGGVAGGALTAAVSEGGGLGMIGAGRGGLGWLGRECGVARAATSRPWGIGFLTWAIGSEAVEAAIEQSPAAIMLSFGDPAPFAETIRAAGIPLMVQVTTLDEARRALDVGANVVVAQGTEAGGHGGGRATLPFVPAVVDIADTTPVLAAGGIADGRGLAATLMLGAAGAMIGTRFEATPEALLDPEEAKAITAAEAADTIRGRVLDIATEAGWPERYTARTLRNGFTDTWEGRESALTSDQGALAEFRAAAERGDREYLPIWAGEAVDLITELDSATALVARIAEQAERAITATGNAVRGRGVRH
ncbi:NAD(P)H-dependent flavin oxidoreductase [Mycolicibacterium moriokaense]|uniref:Nitronate monooxygenase n=1 Tax=Mycolicibacterium moriokaense TaxID=39691 RepID=A0A318HC06_9MYCO|nr:nitronate monooxygenase [Mycolicibacterium moriokaense]PXX05772.1 nitronate monooxygenase [Mycolicibacterium moriokaense]